MLTGLLKGVFPAHNGTWYQDGHMIASGTQLYLPPPPAYEVLGMWYIPLVLTVGSLTLLATTFVIRTSLRISQRWQAKLSRRINLQT